MYTLVFDTTASSCSICLLENGKIIDSFAKNLDFGQSELLLTAIRDMLSQKQLSFDSIGSVFVCVGPGSFTGVRASISAAKIFGIARPEIIISGFTAFDGYVMTLTENDIAACNAVIIETKRDDFYVKFYDNKLNPLGEAETLSRDDVITYLKKQGGLVTLVGDGVERFLNQPSGLSLHGVKMFDAVPLEALAAVAISQQKNKKFNFPKPYYIRPADVTIK